MTKQSAGSGGATASGVIAAALSQIGVKYTWGGEAPGKDFDCSGLTQWAYSTVGVILPRTSEAQYGATTQVSRAQAMPGDLVFSEWGESGPGPGHVGIYLGGGEYVDAPHTGAFIGVNPVPSGSTYGRVPGVTMDVTGTDVAAQATGEQAQSTGAAGTCGAKGKIFGVAGLSFSYCEGKALVGGLTVGLGAGTALVGVLIIVAWGLGNTKAGKAAVGAVAALPIK